MQVATYISDLLYRHECVVVPDFGAILSRRVPAQYFSSSHTIYPPKKGLSFNSQITQNDGLLVNYIASVEQLPYQDAVQQVRNYVRFLDHELDEKGQVTIHKIGRFYKDADQAVQFTPMYLVNYLTEAYGLAFQEAYAIDRAAVVLPDTGIETAREEKVRALPVQEDAVQRNTGWIKVAAAAALLIAGSYIGYNSYTDYSERNALTVQQYSNEALRARVQEATFIINDPLPVVAVPVDTPIEVIQDYNYHIVAGAFRNPANADKKISQLKKLGFTAQRIGVNKYGLHNVAFSSHATRNAAINELNRLRRSGHASAWLLTGKLSK